MMIIIFFTIIFSIFSVFVLTETYKKTFISYMKLYEIECKCYNMDNDINVYKFITNKSLNKSFSKFKYLKIFFSKKELLIIKNLICDSNEHILTAYHNNDAGYKEMLKTIKVFQKILF